MMQPDSTTQGGNAPADSTQERTTDELPLSDAEVSELASIIVYDSGCQPKHDADTVALALVRLAYGVATSAALYVQENPFNQKPSDAASDAAGNAAIHVALGCFHRTHAHGTALEGFMEQARRFKADTEGGAQ